MKHPTDAGRPRAAEAPAPRRTGLTVTRRYELDLARQAAALLAHLQAIPAPDPVLPTGGQEPLGESARSWEDRRCAA